MTEQNIELLQQRISHLEKLADDAGKTLAFLQSRVDTLTAERDQLIEKNGKLTADNDTAIAAERAWETTMMHVCGEDGPASVADKFKAILAENVGLKEVLSYVINPDNEPEYHDMGMGCGVEDRGLQRDGYGACAYGWESAMERVYSEVIPDSLPETPATDAAIAALKAESKSEALDEMAKTYRCLANEDGCSCNMKSSYNLTAERAENYAAYVRRQFRHGGEKSWS